MYVQIAKIIRRYVKSQKKVSQKGQQTLNPMALSKREQNDFYSIQISLGKF